MATLTEIMLTCDMCGNAKDVQTQTFGLDGKTYQIDLCPKDSKRLNQAVAGYVSKARKNSAQQSPRPSSHKPRSRAGTAARSDSAREADMEISDRGRVPAVVFRDYEAAH